MCKHFGEPRGHPGAPRGVKWSFGMILAPHGLSRGSKTGLQQSGASVVYIVQNSLFGPKLSSRRGEMGGKGNLTAISHTCEGPIEENSMISRNELGGSKWRSTDKNNGF